MRMNRKSGKTFMSLTGNSCNGIPVGIWKGEFHAKEYKLTFDKGKITRIRINSGFGFNWQVEVKNNQADGSFRYTYFPSGLAHITGQFDKGRKVGKWIYLWFDKTPWVEVDYGTLDHPKKDTLLYKSRPKSLRDNYIEGLKVENVVIKHN
jgi:hypothetical protein